MQNKLMTKITTTKARLLKFSHSTQLSTKFIMLINATVAIFGILTFINVLNAISENLEAGFFFSF